MVLSRRDRPKCKLCLLTSDINKRSQYVISFLILHLQIVLISNLLGANLIDLICEY